jgi:flagellar hook-associated protein 3 FlgL
VAGNPTDLMAVIKGLGDALQGGVADPAAAARAGLDALSQGLDAITTGQTLVGARMAWIDLTNERRTSLNELQSGEESNLGSTDIAASIADLQQVMLVLEASQASFAKLASLSLFDLLH